MSSLHIVNKTPERGTALQDCLRCASEEDAILLIEDAVYLARDTAANGRFWHDCRMNIHVLEKDCQARGVSAVCPTINILPDAGFVQLACDHNKVVSWF